MSKLDNKFPILGRTGSVKYVKWDKLDENWAQEVHGQSLSRLAERGGLCWEEVYLNYYKKPWSHNIKGDDPKLWSQMVDAVAYKEQDAIRT